jgi:hypothetical protein
MCSVGSLNMDAAAIQVTLRIYMTELSTEAGKLRSHF